MPRPYLLDRMVNVGQHILIEVGVTVQSSQILDKLLHRHRDVQTLRIVIVLVHVQHDDRVSQPESGIRIREWFVVACLLRKFKDRSITHT